MRERAYQQLAELISMAGGIDGRKKLQKIVFILKNKGARLNALPPTILELLATFYYLQAKGYSQSDMLTKTFQLKPHLKAQSQEAQKYWADLTGN